MNRLSPLHLLIPCLALVACGEAPDPAGADLTPDHRIASLALDDGSQIDFYESADEILMHATAGSLTGRAVAEVGLALDAPVDVFLTLSGGAEVPMALVQAQARVETLEAPVAEAFFDALEPPADPSDAAAGAGLSQRQQPLSAGDFRAQHCPSGWEFLICWTQVTGSATVDRRGFSMQSVANVYRNVVTHSLQHRSWGSWVTDFSISVHSGDVNTFGAYGGFNKRRRARVRNASGDGYHLSVYGLNTF
jgi:hypothetical protein